MNVYHLGLPSLGVFVVNLYHHVLTFHLVYYVPSNPHLSPGFLLTYHSWIFSFFSFHPLCVYEIPWSLILPFPSHTILSPSHTIFSPHTIIISFMPHHHHEPFKPTDHPLPFIPPPLFLHTTTTTPIPLTGGSWANLLQGGKVGRYSLMGEKRYLFHPSPPALIETLPFWPNFVLFLFASRHSPFTFILFFLYCPFYLYIFPSCSVLILYRDF